MQGAFCSNAGLTCTKGEGRKEWVEKPYSVHSAKISNSWPGSVGNAQQNLPIRGILDWEGRFWYFTVISH